MCADRRVADEPPQRILRVCTDHPDRLFARSLLTLWEQCNPATSLRLTPACCTAVAFSAKLASPRTTSAMCPEMADAFAIAVCALHARPAP